MRMLEGILTGRWGMPPDDDIPGMTFEETPSTRGYMRAALAVDAGVFVTGTVAVEQGKLYALRMTPPAPVCWVEWTCSGLTNGVLVYCHEREPGSDVAIPAHGEVAEGWTVGVTAFIQDARGGAPRALALGNAAVYLDADGTRPRFTVAAVSGRIELAQGGRKHEVIGSITSVAMYIFSLMHCKNVSVAKESAPPLSDKRKRKKWRERTAGIRFHTLRVDAPGAKRSTRGDPKGGPAPAMHICRGHFSDHRAHGLFGDPARKGIYWTPMHVRGDRKNGTVLKDYEVRVK